MKWWHLLLLGILGGIWFTIGSKLVDQYWREKGKPPATGG